MSIKEKTKSKSKDYKFKFSFVMPIYNVEKYLDETVQSILDQTMDFEQNCEIIFINDGSPDNSEKICLDHQRRFPGNIKYIKQDNQGVSAARNHGLEKVQGKYVSFLDSDDKLSPDTLETAFEFMEKHYDEIDIASIKLEFFDAKEGPHVLNWKFDKSQVIDLNDNPEYVQLSSSSAFIKNETIQNGGYRFDTNVTHSEDSKFITEILLEKLRIGILSEPTYYYRRRQENNSAINSSYMDKEWYLGTPKLVYGYLFDLSKNKYGYIHKYIQHLVMYDLQWRFLQEKQLALRREEEKDYKQLLFGLIKHIDTDIILFQKNIYTEHKIYLIKNKLNLADSTRIKRRGREYYIDGIEIYSYEKNNQSFVVAVTEIGEHNLLLQGTVRGYLLPGVRIGYKCGDEFIEATKINYGQKPSEFLGEKLYEANNYKLNIRLRHGRKITLGLSLVDGTFKPISIIPGRHSKLSPFNGRSYFVTNNYIVHHKEQDSLYFLNKTKISVLVKEAKYLKALLLGHQLSAKASVRIVALRSAYHVMRPFIHKKIWLISDRPSMAGDNGEAFFRYAVTQNRAYSKSYFVLSKKSKDYGRLSKYGKVIDPQSIKYKVLFLLSDKVISSAADDFVINPYREGVIQWIIDLPKFEFVFLQHGVIYNDLSGWLNKFNKNITNFVTTSRREYDSIRNGEYGYGSNELLLTGQARHDYLNNTSTNDTIVVMPTWRSDIVGSFDKGTLSRQKSKTFTNTNFYKQWQSFISDEGLNRQLKANKIKVEFYLHPALHANLDDFKGTANVEIMKPPFTYRDALTRGSLLITDYSSVAFDFAYLHKPLLYFQFDHDDFYTSHMFKKGYFSYEKGAFGPVVKSTEELVLEVRKFIGRKFMLDDKYNKRIDGFFAWSDKNNSLRIYMSLIQKDFSAYVKAATKVGKTINTSKRVLNAYWRRLSYPSVMNFGDDLTAYIVKSIWGIEVKWTPLNQAEFIGVGSILERADKRGSNNPMYVWGSGYIEDGAKAERDNHLKFVAVRGNLTLDRIRNSQNQNIATGDPGILASIIFQRTRRKSHKIGFVYNYIDEDSPLLQHIKDKYDCMIINPLQPADKVARDITSCEIVFSSSLHGLIFADSYKVPNFWLPLSSRVIGGDYKFKDYYSATGRTLKKVSPETLKDNAEIERLKREYEPIRDLEKVQNDLINAFPYADRSERRKY